MLWQILIPTIPHRRDRLAELLSVLGAQMRPGVEVLVYADNLEASYQQKLQALADAATAEYTSHLADDDSVSADFLPLIRDVLSEKRPDYIGFRVRYTENGELQWPVIHSMKTGGWAFTGTHLIRDFMYYNPIRRELAEQVKFRGAYCDEEWAEDIRRLDIVKSEVFIDAEMLYYRRTSSDNFHTVRQPWPADEIPPLPSCPFVRYISP
jgi:hypothetical protein